MKHCEDKCSGWYNYHDHYFGDRDPLGFCLVNSGGMPSNQEISKYVNGIVTNCPWCGARLIEDKKEEKKPDKTQEYYRLHYEMWNWVAGNPEKSKEDWFRFKNMNQDDIYLQCFLCDLHKPKNEAGHKCGECPLKMSRNKCHENEGNWFDRWGNAPANETCLDDIWRTRTKYARKIRDVVLPYLDKPEKKDSALDIYINYRPGRFSKEGTDAWKEVNERLKALEE